MMSGDRFEVSVTFVPAKGYVAATAPELRSAVMALSLGSLPHRIDALILDRSASAIAAGPHHRQHGCGEHLGRNLAGRL